MNNLVANGYAEVSTYPPDVNIKNILKYNAEARAANKGLWAINPNGTTKVDSNNTSSSSSSNQSSGNTNSNSSSSSTSNSSGTTTNEPAQGNRTVYWTSCGKSYHYDRNCRALSKSKNVLEGSASACSKTDPCDICVK